VADPSAVPQVTDILWTVGGALAALFAGYAAYKKPPNTPDPSKDVAVVSASLFSDKQLIMDLLAALRGVERTLECTNELLEADAQRRHDEAIIRDALAKHGVIKHD
jgi:hypothetical protein